ncbi:MAG: stage II sporulation protein M [Treponema sp.]|jgi:uncharacterized membrane protein SpoIIM required for sporulation|nr:stage II sporulation protein M [Treponema sp.]
MTEHSFIVRRDKFWREFAETLGSARLMRERADCFPRNFREICQDLNTARAHGFDPALIERLNRMVLEGHQRLYNHRDFSLRPLLIFLTRTFPRAVRAHRRGIGASCLIFYGLALFFALFCLRFPEMAYHILPAFQAESLEEMYDPQSSHFLVPRELSGDADMFGFYIYNNVSIAFQTFAGGILGGLGSLFFLAYNAMSLGVAAGHIINVGFKETFFSFIIGHSSFELTAIVFSAYAGLLMGYRFFVCGGLGRGASLRRSGREALPIITGAALLLVIAAAVEAFWSSQVLVGAGLRFIVGGLGWVLLGLYFVCAGRDKKGGGGKAGYGKKGGGMAGEGA